MADKLKRALIFDMDGTIVDNMTYHSAAWLEFFKRRGHAIDEQDFLLRTTGRHGREIMREYIRADLPDAENDALNAEKEAIYRELYAPHLKAIRGLGAFIARAKASDIALAVGTSATQDNIRFTLDGLDLRRRFDAVVSAADVKRGKPAPDVFLKAAERCGVAPEQCIVFEDAPLGVQAARNAGMRAVVITTTMAGEVFSAYDNVIAMADDYSTLAIDSLFAVSRPHLKPPRTATNVRIEHVAYWTPDLERLKTFFITYFGATAEPKYTNAKKGFTSYFLNFDSGARIEIMSSSALTGSTAELDGVRVGMAHLAISVGSEQAVDELTSRLRADGYRVIDGPRRTGDGHYESVVIGPDGNRIEVTA